MTRLDVPVTDDHRDLLCLDLPRAELVRQQLPHTDQLAVAASAAKALSDPTRLKIAMALNVGGELCVCDLAWICGLPQNLASHHLRRLRAASLASSRRSGKLVMYSLTAEGTQLTTATQTIPASKP